VSDTGMCQTPDMTLIRSVGAREGLLHVCVVNEFDRNRVWILKKTYTFRFYLAYF